jgi:hypothetical protein
MSTNNTNRHRRTTQHDAIAPLPVPEDSDFPQFLLPALQVLWSQAGEEHWITTKGNSMWPLIREADRLLLSYTIETVHRGAIVVFSHNGQLIAHRVLKVIPDSPIHFVTKGDNTSRFDPTIRADAVLAQVVAVQRDHRLIALNRPMWRVHSWLIATVGLAAAGAYAWARGFRRRLWGNTPLPGVHLLHKAGVALLTMCLRLFLYLFNAFIVEHNAKQTTQYRHGARGPAALSVLYTGFTAGTC